MIKNKNIGFLLGMSCIIGTSIMISPATGMRKASDRLQQDAEINQALGRGNPIPININHWKNLPNNVNVINDEAIVGPPVVKRSLQRPKATKPQFKTPQVQYDYDDDYDDSGDVWQQPISKEDKADHEWARKEGLIKKDDGEYARSSDEDD